MGRASIYSISILLLWAAALSGQDRDTIRLANASLEGEPHAGAKNAQGIRYWTDCGVFNFPDETPPDIHSAYTQYFDHRGPPSHGSTFIGMVSRDNASFESISQSLSQVLEPGKCYEMEIDLMRAERYVSPYGGNDDEIGNILSSASSKKQNYNKPIILYVYGGTGACGTVELLASTGYVKNTQWQTYKLVFEPKRRYKYITVEASYKRPTFKPYNGNILMDNLKPIIEVNCDGEEEVVAEVAEEPTLPPHKRRKPKTPKPPTVEKPQEVSDVVIAKEKILDLDRDAIRTNQRIEIKNLYFDADTSQIGQGSAEVLDELYEFLQENEDITIEVGGHTNGVPETKYCDKLSSMRAKAVASYLVQRGVAPSRITYKGYGKRRPKATNSTAAGRQKNQRVEITITSMNG